MQKIPVSLIYSRLFIGVFLFATSFLHWQHFNVLAIVLFTIGLLTDVFDGIIAAKWAYQAKK